eukprot:481774-Rhodomonas_salina.1
MLGGVLSELNHSMRGVQPIAMVWCPAVEMSIPMHKGLGVILGGSGTSRCCGVHAPPRCMLGAPPPPIHLTESKSRQRDSELCALLPHALKLREIETCTRNRHAGSETSLRS